MKIVPIDRLPDRFLSSYKNMHAFCQKFIEMNVKYAKIEVDDTYSSTYAAFGSLRGVVTRADYPFYVTMVNGELYFVRTDMED